MAKLSAVQNTFRVCLGGTFEIFHEGHKKLIRRALEVAMDGKILIGLTTDDYANSTRERIVAPYSDRARVLVAFLEESQALYQIFPLDSFDGPASTRTDLQRIVVSRESLPNAMRINEKRVRRSLLPLEIVVVGLVKDGQGRKMSSTHIRNKNNFKNQ